MDLIQRARQDIIDASKEDQEKNTPKKETKKASSVVETLPEEKKVYVPTISFMDAANEIWPQLNNPKPLPKEDKKVEAKKAKKEQPKVETKKVEIKFEAKKEAKKPVSKPVSFEEAMLDIWPQLAKKPELKKEKTAPKKETPKKVVPTKKSRKNIKKK